MSFMNLVFKKRLKKSTKEAVKTTHRQMAVLLHLNTTPFTKVLTLQYTVHHVTLIVMFAVNREFLTKTFLGVRRKNN